MVLLTKRLLRKGGDNPPYLVFDDLGQGQDLGAEQAKAIVRAVLERKYSHLCSPEYVNLMVESFGDDPVRLRPCRYRTLHSLEAASRTISALP